MKVRLTTVARGLWGEARPLENPHHRSNVFNATFLTRRFQWFHRVKWPRRLLEHSFGLQHSGKAHGGSPGGPIGSIKCMLPRATAGLSVAIPPGAGPITPSTAQNVGIFVGMSLPNPASYMERYEWDLGGRKLCP
jgi:hypothetical protein